MDLYDIAVARKLSGGSGGGGGSSDFSTAEVTVVNETRSSQQCKMPVLDEAYEEYPAYAWAMSAIDAEYEGTCIVPLYKGKALVVIDSENVSTSGSIVDDGGGYYYITGNGTITIS